MSHRAQVVLDHVALEVVAAVGVVRAGHFPLKSNFNYVFFI